MELLHRHLINGFRKITFFLAFNSLYFLVAYRVYRLLDSESYFFRPVCPERRWHPAVDALVIIGIDYVHEIKAFGILIFLRVSINHIQQTWI